jgi:exosome complex RNA-binding protein Rrp4
MADTDKSTINSSSPTELLLIPVPVSESSSASVAATAYRDSKHTLENVSDCEVQVCTDGRVHISCKNKKEEGGVSTMDRIIQLEALDSSPLVLSNIQNSNVVM